jgi:hypothetical protein
MSARPGSRVAEPAGQPVAVHLRRLRHGEARPPGSIHTGDRVTAGTTIAFHEIAPPFVQQLPSHAGLGRRLMGEIAGIDGFRAEVIAAPEQSHLGPLTLRGVVHADRMVSIGQGCELPNRLRAGSVHGFFVHPDPHGALGGRREAIDVVVADQHHAFPIHRERSSGQPIVGQPVGPVKGDRRVDSHADRSVRRLAVARRVPADEPRLDCRRGGGFAPTQRRRPIGPPANCRKVPPGWPRSCRSRRRRTGRRRPKRLASCDGCTTTPPSSGTPTTEGKCPGSVQT